MNKINEIMTAYTSGKKSLEDTNAALKAAGAGFHLDPMHNKLTAEKIAAGYGLLDSGTGSLDVVQVKSGKLVNADCGGMYALVWLKNKMYHVGKDGVTLTD